MHFLFLNQYFPPDPAPTGALLAELATELCASGHTVECVAAGEAYRAGQARGGRMRRELAALGKIFFAGARARRPDIILSATSPPCLILAATILAGWHRARSAHWIMDLYPELAVALGEIRDGWTMRALAATAGWCYRRTNRVVVLDADMATKLQRYGVAAAILRPWVLAPIQEHLRQTDAAPEEPWTWIYSGNLGRAHEWQTLLEAQAQLEAAGSEIRLRFQGGGPSWPLAQRCAGELGLRQVDWQTYVPEAELPASLLRCGLLAVTQRPEAKGMLWPSKLGLITSLPRPIAWVGPVDGAIAEELRALPQAGVFAPGQAAELAAWVAAMHRDTAVEPVVHDPADERRRALNEWRTLLEAIGAERSAVDR